MNAAELDDVIGGFEPWSLWLVRQVLAGRTAVLGSVAGNPFGPEGFIGAVT